MPSPKIELYVPRELTDLERQALYVELETIATWVEVRRPFARRNQRRALEVRDQRELLLLRLQLWRDESDDPALQRELNALAQTIRGRAHDLYMIGLSDGQQLGASYAITTAVRKVMVDLQAYRPHQWDADGTTTRELTSLLRALGTLPKQTLQMTAIDDFPEDYMLLGYAAADIVEEFAAYARVIVRPHFHTARGRAEWTLDETRALVAEIAGTAHEVIYATTAQGDPLAYHLVDAEFMRNWVEHAKYYLHG